MAAKRKPKSKKTPGEGGGGLPVEGGTQEGSHEAEAAAANEEDATTAASAKRTKTAKPKRSAAALKKKKKAGAAAKNKKRKSEGNDEEGDADVVAAAAPAGESASSANQPRDRPRPKHVGKGKRRKIEAGVAAAAAKAASAGGADLAAAAAEKVKAGAFSVRSSLGVPFLIVSPRAFVEGFPAPSEEELQEIVRVSEGFVSHWESSRSVLLCDFEGEFMGFEGKLVSAAFQRTFATDTTSLKPGLMADVPVEPGLLLDLRTELGISLTRRIMENQGITKAIWGAQHDLISLRFTPPEAPLGVKSSAVLDVQLGFSTELRRLSMEKMLQGLPQGKAKKRLQQLPDKSSMDFTSLYVQKGTALQVPLSVDFAKYACDDLHRLGAVLACGRPAAGSFRPAQQQTETFVNRLEREPASVFKENAQRLGEMLGRRSGKDRMVLALRSQRALRTGSLLGFAADDERLQLLKEQVEAELREAGF